MRVVEIAFFTGQARIDFVAMICEMRAASCCGRCCIPCRRSCCSPYTSHRRKVTRNFFAIGLNGAGDQPLRVDLAPVGEVRMESAEYFFNEGAGADGRTGRCALNLPIHAGNVLADLLAFGIFGREVGDGYRQLFLPCLRVSIFSTA